MPHPPGDISQLLVELKAASLTAAALASALADERARTPSEVLGMDHPRAALLRSVPDIESVLAGLWPERRSRSANLVSSLSQAAAVAGGSIGGWADLGDEVLIAQGRSSALMARVILSSVMPAYGRDDLSAPTRFLDVGTGIGSIATALATGAPGFDVTGIDIAERPLAIGRRLLIDIAPDVAARVHLRQEDVTRLTADARYDAIWAPVPFLPDTILDEALDRMTDALRPGGILALGTNPDQDDERLRTADVWIASLTGGSTLTTSSVREFVVRRGFHDLRYFDTVPGGPVLLTARRPLPSH
jgi:2-polyprenyl-3-methyl-5-hydroxy-6-metoxy-1,4-benzoquinol methylase